MPTPPKVAYAEDQEASDSQGEARTVPGTKVSANIQKEVKKKSSKKLSRPHHEKKTKSDDGIVKIEKRDDEETIAESVRVIKDPKTREKHRSQASAPVTGGHSPRKHAPRPATGRDRSVTFNTPHHDKNDKRYFGRETNENITYSSSKSRPSMDPRLPPRRPLSFDARVMPVQFQQPYPSPLVFAAPSPIAYAPSPMQQPYQDAYFGEQPNTLASRFGRTGQPTLSTAPLPAYAEQPRRESRREPPQEIEYEEDNLDEEYEALEREGRRQRRILAAEDVAAERRERRLMEREREREASELMPPPPRRQGSQHQSNNRDPRLSYAPESPSMEDMCNRRHSRGSFDSERPRITHHRTAPVPDVRRPSMNSRAPASSSSASYTNEFALPHRSRHPRIEVPHGRRSSFYGGTDGTGTTTSSYEEKEREAMGYQNDVAAEAPPLTAEWLRQQQKSIGAGSRSTRSTTSRDDSDVKRSTTTRTTRSGSGDGNDKVQFTVSGNAQLKIGNAELNTTAHDGPITITLENGGEPSLGQRTIRNGSEASYRSSATTAVSDEALLHPNLRPTPHRRDSMTSRGSHRTRQSVDDARYPPRADQNQHLRARMNPSSGGLNRSSSHRESRGYNHIDFERQW